MFTGFNGNQLIPGGGGVDDNLMVWFRIAKFLVWVKFLDQDFLL